MSVSAEYFNALSDNQLRDELVNHGINVGPIGQTTRKLYENKLMKLMGNVTNSEVLLQATSLRAVTPDIVLQNGSRHGTPQPEMNGFANNYQSVKSPNGKNVETEYVSPVNGGGDAHFTETEIVDVEMIEEEYEEVGEGEESVRELSPSEFHSRFRSFGVEEMGRSSSSRSLRGETASAGAMGIDSSSPAASCVIAVALVLIVLFSLALISYINFGQLSSTDVKDEF